MKQNKGETLTETLVALLIGVLALLMLPLAIVTSSRINHDVTKNEKMSTVEKKFGEGAATSVSGASVWVGTSGSEGGTSVNGVTVYKDGAGYYYYEYQVSSGT